MTAYLLRSSDTCLAGGFYTVGITTTRTCDPHRLAPELAAKDWRLVEPPLPGPPGSGVFVFRVQCMLAKSYDHARGNLAFAWMAAGGMGHELAAVTIYSWAGPGTVLEQASQPFARAALAAGEAVTDIRDAIGGLGRDLRTGLGAAGDAAASAGRTMHYLAWGLPLAAAAVLGVLLVVKFWPDGKKR